MPDLLHVPVDNQSLSFNSECKTGFSESEPPRPVVGFVGGAAMMFLGMAVVKMLFSGKRKPLPPYYLTPEQHGLLTKVIARGEEKRWDLSYDEYFVFKLLPALKTITR